MEVRPKAFQFGLTDLMSRIFVRNILPEGKAFLFLLEYVPVVSTGFAIHASVIFSLKLSLQATRLVQ